MSITARHLEIFGSPAAGVWSAPGRVNVVGEHTDYNGGLVLPIAIPQRTSAACSPRGDALLRVHSLQNDDQVHVDLADVGPGRPAGWAAYVAGVLWALRQDGLEIGGLDVTIDSDVPLGAGLSSSAALECSVALAASDLFGLGLAEGEARRARLARACVRAENDIAGAPTGGMDQSASLLCREGHALLLDCRDGTTRQVPFDVGEDHVLLVTDTRAHHALNDGQYAARRASCQEAARRLGVESLRELEDEDPARLQDRLDDDELTRRARHVITEIARVRQAVTALRARDLAGLGHILDASHDSLRDDYEVSCPELDVAVDAARDAGALGARMTGGGFGGSTIALLPTSALDVVQRQTRRAFEVSGWKQPRCFVVTPGPPARRDA